MKDGKIAREALSYVCNEYGVPQGGLDEIASKDLQVLLLLAIARKLDCIKNHLAWSRDMAR